MTISIYLHRVRLLPLAAIFWLSCQSSINNKDGGSDQSNYFDSIRYNDIKLATPQTGEWRARFNEPHQSLGDYLKSNPRKATAGKTKLYLLPLGRFSEIQWGILQRTREYLSLFFQLETIIQEPYPDDRIPNSAKRINQNSIQLYTPYILEQMLKGKIPADGYALMAISEKDLYPSPDWNFVFGIASYQERIGVSSIFRYQEAGLDSNNFSLCLRRLVATASHEIGHMFSLRHCVVARCVMNGSNSLSESDRQPLRLCSECQEKLHWNIGYDNHQRLDQLIRYMKRNKLSGDQRQLEKDRNLLN